MQEVRCPDCGYRLKTNECPICCKKVPFPAAVKQKTTYKRPQRNIQVSFPKTGFSRKKRANSNPKMKIISAVIAVVFALIPLVSEILDDIQLGTREPDYPDHYEEMYHSDYVEAGLPGAEHVPTVAPRTVYEDHGIAITVESFGLWYDNPAMLVTISNTSDRNVTVSTDSMAVNGYMINSAGLFYETQSGETVQTYLRLYADDLEEAGIETVSQVQMRLDLYDGDDYSDIDHDIWIELETSATGVAQTVDDSGILVYDADGVRLIFKDAQVDEYGDGQLRFFVENLTDHPVNIGSDMVYLNDQETDGMLWCQLWPNTRSVNAVYLFDLAEYKISKTSDIRNITLELYIENAENWETVYETVLIDIFE